MTSLKVDLAKTLGKIKPMHAVNNGPVYKFAADQRITNIDPYRDAGIPYARTHDASFYATYGGEHTVDVHAIFPDFCKDPYDPASYDFPVTDEYMKVINHAGTEVFYRLGSKIEHGVKKYGTLPPEDFKKWAVICEHIIRHYTEGWADGFNYKITYWEIWNEPDLDPDDSPHKRCWGGTKQQFFEFYDIAASHLKEKFPHLKIGGPALAGNLNWAKDFLKQLKAPLDFFSWHWYGKIPSSTAKRCIEIRNMLDEAGFKDTESILNEWNYVKGWTGDDWYETLKCEKGIKGAAYISSVMAECQKVPVDMLMYYDARPGAMNGMFCTDRVCELLKGYYPFKAFNELYRLGTEVESVGDGEYSICAATNGQEYAVMASRCSDSVESETVKIHFGNCDHPVKTEYYLLDEDHDLELVREEIFTGVSFTSVLKFKPDSMYLIKLSPVEI